MDLSFSTDEPELVEWSRNIAATIQEAFSRTYMQAPVITGSLLLSFHFNNVFSTDAVPCGCVGQLIDQVTLELQGGTRFDGVILTGGYAILL